MAILFNLVLRVLRNAMGMRKYVRIIADLRYEGARYNVISIARGWVSNFQKKVLRKT